MSIRKENQEPLSAFAVPAEQYCAFIESLGEGVPCSYRHLEDLLAGLHAAILPVEKEMSSEDRERFEKMRLSHEDWKRLGNTIGKVTEKETAELFACHESNGNDEVSRYCSVRASMLWDDLADIYIELHHGLALWKLATPDSQAEAAWQWRFGYETHWGRHLFRALETVHEIRYRLHSD